MRLLRIEDGGEFSLVEYVGRDIPRYAILSHTWGEDHEEVSFKDFTKGLGKGKAGYWKLTLCGKLAASDGLQFFWVNTCCIDKSSSAELQETINSMFQWYRKADKCYAYLSDVSTTGSDVNDSLSQQAMKQAFQDSRWFTRGWTLQELLAPMSVEFFTAEGKRLGDRASLVQEIHDTTRIPLQALQEKRVTKREEDKAYALLGVFSIHIPLIYGEGEENAFRRLREEIDKSLKDPLQQQVSTQIHRMQPDRVMDIQGINQAPWLVPLPRPQSFVGREAELARLSAHVLSGESLRLAIYGLGGCGKTALALELAYLTRGQQPTRAIFWVPAVSQESFEQAYREIGTLLHIPGILDDTTNLNWLVKAKLSNESFGQWLMIVDNADDVGILFNQLEGDNSTDRLIELLPRSRNGSIIFTTRTRVAAVRLAESSAIALGELDDAEAREVLKTRLIHEHQHQLGDEETVRDFLSMLSFLALAIIQAVAFINANDITLSDYIILYRHSERNAIDLLSEEFEDQGRYRATKNPVGRTWYISFEQIRRQNELAANYLSFMACTANNNIPASMLLADSSDVERTKAIGILKSYAFIAERQRRDKQQGRQGQQEQNQRLAKTFDVHPLVHLAIRGWLEAHNQWHVWLGKTLARLVEIIPFGDHETRDIWTAYLPHARHIMDLPEVYKTDMRMSLLERIGWCERTLGQYKAAERAHRQALEQREKVLGKEHPDTLASMNNVANSLSSLGKYVEAEKLHRETLALSKKVSGKKHPQTLTSMNNMARALDSQGKYTEAEKMHRETLLLSEKVLGKKHPHTLTSMNNVARALDNQGKYTEAEDMHRETLALREEVLGKEHPHTLISMSNLAGALDSQGKYAEAEKIQRETLALREKVLGKEHPDTLMSVYCLSYSLRNQHQYEKALPLFERASTGYQNTLGLDHPFTRACSDHYTAIQKLVDAQPSVNDGHRFTEAVIKDTHYDAEDSNTTELASKPQDPWRRRLKKWKLRE